MVQLISFASTGVSKFHFAQTPNAVKFFFNAHFDDFGKFEKITKHDSDQRLGWFPINVSNSYSKNYFPRRVIRDSYRASSNFFANELSALFANPWVLFPKMIYSFCTLVSFTIEYG